MKNLTDSTILLMNSDNSRATLAPVSNPPQLVVQEPVLLGFLGPLEIIRERAIRVDFGDLVLDPSDQPFIVSRAIFDALPDHRIEFITPDYESAILNSMKVPHVIRRFIAKAAARITNPAPSNETP
jgi:hypothetical protein